MTSNAFSETVSVALGQVQVREDPFLALWELMPWLREKRWFEVILKKGKTTERYGKGSSDYRCAMNGCDSK